MAKIFKKKSFLFKYRCITSKRIEVLVIIQKTLKNIADLGSLVKYLFDTLKSKGFERITISIDFGNNEREKIEEYFYGFSRFMSKNLFNDNLKVKLL